MALNVKTEHNNHVIKLNDYNIFTERGTIEASVIKYALLLMIIRSDQKS